MDRVLSAELDVQVQIMYMMRQNTLWRLSLREIIIMKT